MAESDAGTVFPRHSERSALTINAARMIFFSSVSFGTEREGAMKKIAAVMVLALLPLAGCANPRGASNGPYTAYDSDYDQGYDGYDQPYYGPSYGPSGYGPGPSASGYGPGSGAYGGAYGPGYAGPANPNYYGQNYYGQNYYGQSYSGQSYSGQSVYDRAYGPTYRPSGYASSYYSPPPPPPLPGYGQPSPYYSTY